MAGNIFEYESGGILNQNIIMANFNTRFQPQHLLNRKLLCNSAKDLPGSPTNPYSLFSGLRPLVSRPRQNFVVIGSVLAPLAIRLSPFVTLKSGSPYDVLLGTDLYGDTETNARPGFAANNAGLSPFSPAFYNPKVTFNGPFIPRNFYLTGAARQISVNMRIGRTFGFGPNR